jgi:hypothetical protein
VLQVAGSPAIFTGSFVVIKVVDVDRVICDVKAAM